MELESGIGQDIWSWRGVKVRIYGDGEWQRSEYMEMESSIGQDI